MSSLRLRPVTTGRSGRASSRVVHLLQHATHLPHLLASNIQADQQQLWQLPANRMCRQTISSRYWHSPPDVGQRHTSVADEAASSSKAPPAPPQHRPLHSLCGWCAARCVWSPAPLLVPSEQRLQSSEPWPVCRRDGWHCYAGPGRQLQSQSLSCACWAASKGWPGRQPLPLLQAQRRQMRQLLPQSSEREAGVQACACMPVYEAAAGLGGIDLLGLRVQEVRHAQADPAPACAQMLPGWQLQRAPSVPAWAHAGALVLCPAGQHAGVQVRPGWKLQGASRHHCAALAPAMVSLPQQAAQQALQRSQAGHCVKGGLGLLLQRRVMSAHHLMACYPLAHWQPTHWQLGQSALAQRQFHRAHQRLHLAPSAAVAGPQVRQQAPLPDQCAQLQCRWRLECQPEALQLLGRRLVQTCRPC